MSTQCVATKRNGELCRGVDATPEGFCWAHAPENKDKQRRTAAKGGRSKGGGAELKELKREVRTVIGGVLNGRIDKGDGSVALQGYNVLLRAHELSQKADIDELSREVEEMKKSAYGRAS